MARPDLHLPEEILASIVYYLTPQAYVPQEPAKQRQHAYDLELVNVSQNAEARAVKANLRTLARLSQVSKQLQRLAEPVLYQRFPGHWMINARLWLTAIVAKPGRAQHVQHITVDEFVRWRADKALPDEDEDWDNDLLGVKYTFRELLQAWKEKQLWHNPSTTLYDQLLPRLTRLVINAVLPDTAREKLEEALWARRGSTSLDLMYSLIVLACPNLRSIDIWVCDGFQHALLPTALASPAGTIKQVSLFRHGKQAVPEYYEEGAVQILARQFKRPGVEVIHATNQSLKNIQDFSVYDDFGTVRRVKLDREALVWPSIKCISLQDCKLNPSHFEILLMICPSLTTLELRSCIVQNAIYPLWVYGKFLREYGTGLQRLVYDPRDASDDSRGTLGSLRPLARLKTLVITDWTLLGSTNDPDGFDEDEREPHLADLIPSNLESLTILGTDTLPLDIEDEVSRVKANPAFEKLVIESRIRLDTTHFVFNVERERISSQNGQARH